MLEVLQDLLLLLYISSKKNGVDCSYLQPILEQRLLFQLGHLLQNMNLHIKTSLFNTLVSHVSELPKSRCLFGHYKTC